MPTEQFFKLTEDKQQLILDVALEEFSLHAYEVASITQMVKRCEISKGSMYAYIESKQQLYYFLFDKIFARLQQALHPEKISIKNLWKWYVEYLFLKQKFYWEFPTEAAFIKNFENEKWCDELGNQYQMRLDHDMAYFKNQIQARKQFKKSDKLDFLAYQFTVSSRHFAYFVDVELKRLGTQFQFENQQKPVIQEGELKEICKRFVKQLKK
jgi:AcrR family transcriptional regulator